MILLVEDNPRLSKNITEFLELEKFSVTAVRDGKTGLELALSQKFSVLLLDLNLPLLDGMEVCRQLRSANISTPILILTARGSTKEKVEGLNAGADDYLAKPFDFEELIARIRALQRRDTTQKSEKYIHGDIEISFATREVQKEGKKIILSPKEFGILEFLIRNTGRVKSRTEILSAVWGVAEEEKLFHSDTVEVHIAYLRKKLGKKTITTVRGMGYTIPT